MRIATAAFGSLAMTDTQGSPVCLGRESADKRVNQRLPDAPRPSPVRGCHCEGAKRPWQSASYSAVDGNAPEYLSEKGGQTPICMKNQKTGSSYFLVFIKPRRCVRGPGEETSQTPKIPEPGFAELALPPEYHHKTSYISMPHLRFDSVKTFDKKHCKKSVMTSVFKEPLIYSAAHFAAHLFPPAASRKTRFTPSKS